VSRKNKKVVLKKSQGSFALLIKNDKFLLALSIVISFFLWTAVSMQKGETANYPISDIPVTIELSDDAIEDHLTVVSINGLSVDEFKTTVKVKGNSVTVGSLTASDIQVYGANLGNIVTSGTYNVNLLAKQIGIKSNYDIVSLYPSEVSIVVDRNIEKEFTIESKITASTPAGYYIGSPSFSQKSVTVSGPEQSVSKVAKAVVEYIPEEELTSTTLLDNLSVTLLDEKNKVINDDALIVEPLEVDATIPVLLKKTVPFTLNYENKPDGIDLDEFIKIEPSEIEIAAAKDIIDSIESISLGTLDFNKLSYGEHSMEFDTVMPEGVRNLNNIEKVTVSFNFSGYSTKTFTITAFSFRNVPAGLIGEYSPYSSIIVRAIGPKQEISKLSSSDVLAVIDLSDAKVGNFDVPLVLSVPGAQSCWIYGEYELNVTLQDLSTVSSEIDSDIESDSVSSNTNR